MRNLNNVLLTAALLIAPAMTWAQTSAVSPGTQSISADQVSFYQVPLACPAARNLGCGSRAKPVLLSLEKKNTIQEAWLDHPGTTLAIVWKGGTTAYARDAEMRAVAEEHHILLHELTGDRRDETLKRFLSRKEWYRGADVDRLSEEEALVIVDRLIRRATANTPSIAGKSEPLKLALAKVIREQLTTCHSTECRDNFREKLADTARKNLTGAEFNALMEATKLGYRAVGDEQ